jgi:hypothetical protein
MRRVVECGSRLIFGGIDGPSCLGAPHEPNPTLLCRIANQATDNLLQAELRILLEYISGGMRRHFLTGSLSPKSD